jgi:pyruvate/2-oxoacid:ferredoxin oxidoreductase beta subunit
MSAPDTYIDQKRLPLPFCPGCSHGKVLHDLDKAMVKLGLNPARTVLVTDIGCSGLSDQWFSTHAFHGLHGRSMAYAQGIKLADPSLKVIVIMGDGGAGIGGHHLLNLAKRNIGVTVLLLNNFNFGMTGGEHSVATPEGTVTSTTPGGHFEHPLMLCETLALNGAPFVARRGFFDDDLVDLLASAIAFDGFAFVEVLELCTAYFSPWNKFGRKQIEDLLAGEVPRMTGIKEARTEYTKALQQYREKVSQAPKGEPELLEQRFVSDLKQPLDIVIAGSAGMKIKSLATTLGKAAILSGAFAAQSNDYPVTVQTGHSVSYLKISPHPIGYMGLSSPDVLFVLSEDGHAKARKLASSMERDQTLVTLDGLPPLESKARMVTFHPDRLEGRVPKEYLATVALSAFLKRGAAISYEALKTAMEETGSKKAREKNLSFAQQASTDLLVDV